MIMEPAGLEDLPTEVMYIILNYLSTADRLIVADTSHKFKVMVRGLLSWNIHSHQIVKVMLLAPKIRTLIIRDAIFGEITMVCQLYPELCFLDVRGQFLEQDLRSIQRLQHLNHLNISGPPVDDLGDIHLHNISSLNLKCLSLDQQLLNGSTFLMNTKTDQLTELRLIEIYFSDEGMANLFTFVENLEILELKRVEGVDLEMIFVELSEHCAFKTNLQKLIIKLGQSVQCTLATLAAINQHFSNLFLLELTGGVKHNRHLNFEPHPKITDVALNFTQRLPGGLRKYLSTYPSARNLSLKGVEIFDKDVDRFVTYSNIQILNVAYTPLTPQAIINLRMMFPHLSTLYIHKGAMCKVAIKQYFRSVNVNQI